MCERPGRILTHSHARSSHAHVLSCALCICLSISYSFHLIYLLCYTFVIYIHFLPPPTHDLSAYYLPIQSDCTLADSSRSEVNAAHKTLLALLLQSSKVTDRWSHCFPLFAHAFFIAMFKDHTHVLQALTCLLHFVFCRLLCHKLLRLGCFLLLFEQQVLRTWLLSNDTQPFELRKPKFWEYYFMKTKLFKSRHLTLSDAVAFHMGLDLNLSTTASDYNATLVELSALFK